jgi:hypothetical protein
LRRSVTEKLDHYLLEYPQAKSENIQYKFYWEKVNFGLKPTLRIVQAIVYRGVHSTEPPYAIAVKQLYASHYSSIPTLTDRVSSGEIANNLGNNFGGADEQAYQIRVFLQRHRANVERAAATIEQSAPAALAGFVVIPILAIFFLSDGENLVNQVIHLVSAKDNHAALESLAGDLHVMLQRYIRTKVILGGLSLLYCLIAMLLLGFPNAIVLGVLAGILEVIPVAGWMTAAAIIVTAGVLTHSHWIWMLALLAVWRILIAYGIFEKARWCCAPAQVCLDEDIRSIHTLCDPSRTRRTTSLLLNE